jgi:cell division transport system permease protein
MAAAWCGTRLEGCMGMALRIDYYFKETLQGLKRNGLVAFAAVSTAFIALFLVGGALLVKREVDLLSAQTQANIEVAVFLRDDVSPSQQRHLGDTLNRMPEVASVHYESKEEAYRRFLEIFKTQKALVDNVSPDSLPASFRVKLKDAQNFRVVAARLAGQSGIDKIVDQREILNRLFAVTRVFRVGVLAVAIVMLISSAALIGNTVRLAVFNRRKEIGIMRLVGATNWHIRLPFLIEGIIEGLLGAGAAILGLFIMKVAFIDPLRGKVGFLPLVGTPDVIFTVPWLLGLGVVVAAIASLFAMRQFLDV